MCSGSFVRPPICQKIMFFVELFLLENKTKECLGYRKWFWKCYVVALVACWWLVHIVLNTKSTVNVSFLTRFVYFMGPT